MRPVDQSGVSRRKGAGPRVGLLKPKAIEVQPFVGYCCEPNFPLEYGNANADVSTPFRLQMDSEKDEESRPQPSGPPTRKKFIIPLEEDEVPSGVRAKTWELLEVKETVRDPWDYGVSLGLGCFGKITCRALQSLVGKMA